MVPCIIEVIVSLLSFCNEGIVIQNGPSTSTIQSSNNFTGFASPNLTYNQWVSPSTPKLPIGFAYHAVAYFQNTVHLFGGWRHTRAYLKYNMDTNTFYDYNQSYFQWPDDLSGNSQWWYQIDNILYMIDGSSTTTKLHIFDLANEHFTRRATTAPISHGLYPCLTGDSISGMLYVIGGTTDGLNRSDTLQILNLINMSWSTGPNMNTARFQFACIVSPNQQLYAIGGYDPKYRELSTIEFIATNNIRNNVWSYTQQNLSQAIVETRCVLVDHNIYVIGGYYWGFIDIVQVINTITNFVDVSPYTLAYPVSGAAPIIVNEALYVFGGLGNFTELDRWQYIVMTPTNNATIDPTSTTTAIPTLSPLPYSKTSCGLNQYCYAVDLYPQIDTAISQQVAVTSPNEQVIEYHTITFISNDNPCLTPIISVFFEEIDYELLQEFFDVFDQDFNLIQRCNGDQDYLGGDKPLCP